MNILVKLSIKIKNKTINRNFEYVLILKITELNFIQKEIKFKLCDENFKDHKKIQLESTRSVFCC